MSDAAAASDPKRSAWVSANAGAGKTYILANRVTRLLLDGAKPERILCLTYTKAAAAEMAARLFAQLGQWAMAGDETLRARIALIGAEPRDAEGLREARRLFALALETPGGLKIQTIHSFCQYLLSRFPLEAGVPASFRVLDDETARELREDACTRVLDCAGRGDAELAGAIALLVTETSETQLRALLHAGLSTERRKLERFLVTLPRADGALADAVWDSHGAQRGDSVSSVEAEFLAAMKTDAAALKAIADWLATGSTNDQNIARDIAAALAAESFEAFRDVFLTDKGTPRKKLVTKATAEARGDLFQQLLGFADRVILADERRRAAHAASLAYAAILLIRASRHVYEASKRARAALDYDDLIAATQRLLERRQAAQWVLYKLDGGLDHVLIDEAQDTSPEQWSIVKCLTEEFFAGEGAAGTRKRTIFAVGDEKQSIFSFQGAEPREFDVHRRHFADRIDEAAFADVRLDVSRRSVPEILRFVDQVFASPAAREGVTTESEPIVHRAHRNEFKGRVEFWPLIAPSEKPETDYWRPVDAPSQDSPVVKLAEQIASHIREWTDGRKMLPGRDRPIRAGDVMVLMPRRDPFASALIRALKSLHIPVAGADRIRLAEQIAVQDLVALGRFVLLPEDDLNFASLLRSPLAGITDEELYDLSVERSGSLWHEFAARHRQFAHGTPIWEFFSAALARADFVPPYEFYSSVLSQRGMRKRLLARLGAEAADAIDEFLSLALAYEGLNVPSLEGFLHWVEHGETEVKRDMERSRDEVRVMTVHGAKGLEADIVILPDTASAPGGSGKHAHILYTDNRPLFPLRASQAPEAVRRAKEEEEKRAREEHRRLLYVALTRARDRLYICGFRGEKGANAHSWYTLAEKAAREIGEAVPRGGESMHVLGDGEFVAAENEGAQAAEPIALAPWMSMPAPQEQARPRLIRPSEAAGEDEPGLLSPAGLRNAQRFRRGNLVHSLLAQLPALPPDARRQAAATFLAARQVAAMQADALIDETLRVIEHADIAAAFAPEARAEIAITAELPELGAGARVNGRIDRLAVSDTEIVAVDFKTNRPAPTCEKDVPKLYVAQMALYRAALAKIFPGRRVVCALVWTEGPAWMRLGDAILDEAAGRIAARLDPRGPRS